MVIDVDDIPVDIYRIPVTPPTNSSLRSRKLFYANMFTSHPSREPWINEVFGWCPQCNCLIPFNLDEILNYNYSCPNRQRKRINTYVMSHAYAIFQSTNFGDICHYSVVDSSISGFDVLMSDFMIEHPELFPADINDIEYYTKK